MGLFSIFKKKEKKQDLNKEYLSIDDKSFDEQDMLNKNEVYEIFKKYQGYEITTNLSDKEKINKIINSLMKELNELKIMCRNYDEYDKKLDLRGITLDKVKKLNILESLALITLMQRQDYWTGSTASPYIGYTKSGILPELITRIISLYETKEN